MSPYKNYLETGHLIGNFVNGWYSTTNMLEVSTWEIVETIRIIKAFFIYLFVHYIFLDRPQFALIKLYHIRVLLNHANC